MNLLLTGAITMAYAVVGTFFLRFWKRSGDSLFLFFTAAFWILACQNLLVAILRERNEDVTISYLIRLAAFLLIIFGIAHKNRSR